MHVRYWWLIGLVSTAVVVGGAATLASRLTFKPTHPLPANQLPCGHPLRETEYTFPPEAVKLGWCDQGHRYAYEEGSWVAYPKPPSSLNDLSRYPPWVRRQIMQETGLDGTPPNGPAPYAGKPFSPKP